jgi:hypothetical protein
MDGQCSIQVYFNKNPGGVWGGVDVLPTDSIQSVAIGGVVSDR